MFNLFFSVFVALFLYATVSVARKKWWQTTFFSFSVTRESAKKILVVPVLLLAILVFDALTSGKEMRWPFIGLPLTSLVAVVVLIPIIEEWVRAVIQAFCKECGSAIAGLLISSLFFALLHSLSLDLVYARAFLFALATGLLTMWSGGIAVPVLAHMAANAMLAFVAFA